MAAFKEMLQPRDRGEQNQRDAAMLDIDTVMRKVFEKPADAMQQEKPAQPRRDPATAFDLLERAAASVDVLMGRCRQLEAQMKDMTERAKAEAAAQEEVINQWKQLGSGMKVHAEETERRLEAMKTRADDAESRAAAAEARAAALQEAAEAAARQAVAAENLSTEYHDKVIAAFGIGSQAHVALEAIATTPPVDQGTSAA